MKGTMLIKGESYNQRKRQLLEGIKISRQMIKAMSGIKYHKDLGYLVSDTEQNNIKLTMQELIELRKWQNERQQMVKIKDN